MNRMEVTIFEDDGCNTNVKPKDFCFQIWTFT